MNGDAGYPLDILRSELKTALAEQMVQLIDRFASKADVAEARAEMMILEKQTNGRFQVIDEKLNALLRESDHRDGAHGERNLLRSRRDFWIGIGVALAVAVVGAVATVAAYAFGNG